MGKLVSRLDHPVIITYKKEGVRVSPRAVLRDIDISKVKQPLPKGLTYVGH